MVVRKLTAALATAGILAAAGPIAGAGAATTPAATPYVTPLPSQLTALPSGALTFVPPAVGPICVNIGPIIIGGKVMNPGIHTCTSGVTMAPLSWSLAG